MMQLNSSLAIAFAKLSCREMVWLLFVIESESEQLNSELAYKFYDRLTQNLFMNSYFLIKYDSILKKGYLHSKFKMDFYALL